MTESITASVGHYTPAASLAALGVKLSQINLFGPIQRMVHIAQKTVKHSPLDKLSDSFIAMLAGAHGVVEINTRLRAEGLKMDSARNRTCTRLCVSSCHSCENGNPAFL